MSKESDAFEQLNARIHRLLAASTASITWNASIRDPDDTAEMRQIDVLIEEGGRLASVECRYRDGAQSVMWVEELIGRKQSLALDTMIGVAVDGFSKLAQKKAARYGILLYDFRSLTDQEIASWTGSATIDATFVQFQPLSITAGIHHSNEYRLPADVNANLKFRRKGKDGFGIVMDSIRDDGAAHPGIARTVPLDFRDFDVEGIPLTLLRADYVARLVSIKANCAAVEAVASPSTPVPLRDLTVQRFDHAVTEVIRNQNEVHLVIDASTIRPPQDSILHEMRIAFQSPVTLKGYELIGDRQILTKGVTTSLSIATTT
jgi:hypothetical protein